MTYRPDTHPFDMSMSDLEAIRRAMGYWLGVFALRGKLVNEVNEMRETHDMIWGCHLYLKDKLEKAKCAKSLLVRQSTDAHLYGYDGGLKNG